MGRSWQCFALVVQGLPLPEVALRLSEYKYDITFSLLKIAAFLFILAFIILLARRVFKREEGLVIMPFETSGNEQGKYNGKLVSDLLTGELQRILKVHH